MNLRATLDDLDELADASLARHQEPRAVLPRAAPAGRTTRGRRSTTCATLVTQPGRQQRPHRPAQQGAEARERWRRPDVRRTRSPRCARSTPVLSFIRPYTPDFVGWLRDFGQGAANYDANGHYARIQPIFNAYSFTDNPAGGDAAPRSPATSASTGLQSGNLQPLPGRGQPVRRRRLRAVPRLRRHARLRPDPGAARAMRRLLAIARGARRRGRARRPRHRRADDGGGDYQVRAIFQNAFSLVPGEDVKIAGVKVGKIDSLDVTPDQKAAVVLDITRAGLRRLPQRRRVHDPPAVADRREVRRVHADPAARRRATSRRRRST